MARSGGAATNRGGGFVDEAGRSYVDRRHRFVYVPVAKAACSSLKWAVAELAGEDPAQFLGSTSSSPTRRQTVHDRTRWRHTPRWRDLEPAEAQAVAADPDWFTFTVVRDPWSRLWSAWQSKLLVRNPGFLRYRDRPWFPRVPTAAEQVVDDFARFARALAAGEARAIARDVHFRPQTDVVSERVLRYDRVYDLSELGTAVDDLTAHARRVDPAATVVLHRDNDSPLRMLPHVMTPDVLAVVEQVYAADLARFGDLWSGPPAGPAADDWSADALRDLAYRAAVHERVADLVGLLGDRDTTPDGE